MMRKTKNKKNLIEALDIFRQKTNLSANLDILLSSVKHLGRRRDSNLYLVDANLDGYPDGIVVKIASNRRRISRWNPLEEVAQLDKLSIVGPRSKMFAYLAPIIGFENPHFIALPYFPSVSLRNSVELLKKQGPKNASSRKTMDSFFWVGKWLGLLYDSSPSKSIDSNTITRSFIQDRISELEKYSRVTKIETLTSYIDSIYENLQKAERICPEHFHGDFNLDNILVHSDGRICLVDPEPIRIGLFADFIHFRQSLIILANRGFFKNYPILLEKYSRTFSDGFAGEYEEHQTVGHVYLLAVVKKVSWYYKQGYKNSISITPRGLIYWYDQQKLMRHWVSWLNNLPRDPSDLWSYIRFTL